MTDSVFQTRTLSSICDEIRTVYLNDSRPWILGFSGGKDSTCMAQLVWQALSILPLEKLDKKIYIVSSDTLVESPQIVERNNYIFGQDRKGIQRIKHSNIDKSFTTSNHRYILGKNIGSWISCTHIHVSMVH